MNASIRVVSGFVIGLFARLILVAAVVLTRFAPLVNTPRSSHAFLLVTLFAVPGLGDLLIGAYWPRLRPRR